MRAWKFSSPLTAAAVASHPGVGPFVSFRFDLSSPGLVFRFVSFRNEIPAWRFRFVSFYSNLMRLVSVLVSFLFSKLLENPVVGFSSFFSPVSSCALAATVGFCIVLKHNNILRLLSTMIFIYRRH